MPFLEEDELNANFALSRHIAKTHEKVIKGISARVTANVTS